MMERVTYGLVGCALGAGVSASAMSFLVDIRWEFATIFAALCGVLPAAFKDKMVEISMVAVLRLAAD